MGDSWIVKIEAEREERAKPSTTPSSEKEPFISRVPKRMRDVNEEAYTPRMASVGPYHHGRPHLKPMERHKHRLLHQFLDETKLPLDNLWSAMKKEARELMAAYDDLEAPWTDEDRFVELMIMDGIFMLMVVNHMLEFKTSWTPRYTMRKKDPIFGKPYILLSLDFDLMLVENQLPSAVLNIINSALPQSMPASQRATIDQETDYHLYQGFDAQAGPAVPAGHTQGLHHLEAFRKTKIGEGQDNYRYTLWHPLCATELSQAGVRFKTNAAGKLSDISFDEINGELTLPHMHVDKATGQSLLNLVAFEQMHAASHEVTSYAYLMAALIQTPGDVKVMRENQIISGFKVNEKEIAALFNRLTAETVLMVLQDDDAVNHKLNVYCSKRRNRWRASFIQAYLTNPWVFFSLLGALVLLFLTLAQTVYAVLSYYKF